MTAAILEALATTAALVSLVLAAVGLAALRDRWPQITGWWHSTRVAETVRWHRDGWSWPTSWARSGRNVHDEWPHHINRTEGINP